MIDSLRRSLKVVFFAKQNNFCAKLEKLTFAEHCAPQSSTQQAISARLRKLAPRSRDPWSRPLLHEQMEFVSSVQKHGGLAANAQMDLAFGVDTEGPNRGRPYSPTMASQVRPGGGHAFSEPMIFSPEKGGWINQSQVKSSGAYSPGVKEATHNGNVKASIEESPPVRPPGKSYGIKLGPTEMLMMQHSANNPFTFPSYWDGSANNRGWYDK